MAPTNKDIEQVALALGELKDRCFLAGGVSIPFYITDVLEEPPRVTEDIDVVIEVRSVIEDCRGKAPLPIPFGSLTNTTLTTFRILESAPLSEFVQEKAHEYVPLSSGEASNGVEHSRKWKLFLNATVGDDE